MILFFLFGSNEKRYNLVFYSFASILIATKLIANLVKHFKAQKSILVTGKIVEDLLEEKIVHSNQDNIYTITFLSPIDHKEYSIKSQMEHLPKNGTIEILFNEQEPEASKLYIKSGVLENVSLAFAFVGFLYIIFFRLRPFDH